MWDDQEEDDLASKTINSWQEFKKKKKGCGAKENIFVHQSI
jgi:hypothetical protein